MDSSGTVNYLCDGTDPASAVLADTNATYTPGLSERRGGASKFYHGDSLGSTRGITNSSQTATDGILYDAFGMTMSRTGTTPTPFGFVGAGQYQTDADSGLMLLGHRYYDSSVGRFITSDPIQDGDSWYVYGDNNPLGDVDSEGLFPEKLPKQNLKPTDPHRLEKIRELIKDWKDRGGPRDEEGKINKLKQELNKLEKGSGERGSRHSDHGRPNDGEGSGKGGKGGGGNDGEGGGKPGGKGGGESGGGGKGGGGGGGGGGAGGLGGGLLHIFNGLKNILFDAPIIIITPPGWHFGQKHPIEA